MTHEIWNESLRDQIDWHWRHQLRPRLEGLNDQEYFWEPAPGSWNIRPRGSGSAPVQAGSGAMTIDFAFPPPEPPPFTTIAWRLGHVIVGVLAMRNASHFGRPSTDYHSFDYAATAQGALDQLDAEYQSWLSGVASLGEEGLHRPCGEEGFEQESMAQLVLHIHRELIHHLSEICLLRDLYLHTRGTFNQTTHEEPGMKINHQLVVFDAADLHAESQFWAGALEGTVDADDDWHTVLVGGAPKVGVQLAPDHVPPQWPDGSPPQQIHLDLVVDEIEPAHQKVINLGAQLLQAEEDNDDDDAFRVYTDPAGHPFCLCWTKKP